MLLSLVLLFSPASTVPSGIEVNDKVVHAALFFVLAVTGVVAGLPLRALVFGLVLLRRGVRGAPGRAADRP